MSKKQIATITEKLNIPASSLTPKELVSKIYEATKDEEKLGRFKGAIKKPEDLNASIVILALLLQDDIHAELVNIIFEHSIQNGYKEGGIDLNVSKILNSSDINLLDYAIWGCNYEHFRKLIELNVDYLNCIRSITSWPGKFQNTREYTEQDRENRRKMLKDLLNLGVKVTEDFFKSLTRNSEVDFFEIVAESEFGKKLLTPAFLEELTETAKYNSEYKKNNSMLTTIIKYHKRKRVEEILKQEATKEGMKEMLLITEGEIKKKALSIINSPEFKAQIVEHLIHYYGDELALQIADGLRKKLLENPKQILDLLLPKP